MPYRVAAGVLEYLLPIDAGSDPETLRAHTLKVGADLRDAAPAEPATAAAVITLTLDSTFIRSCEDGQRHLEVRLGNVKTPDGGRQVFAAFTKTDTAIEMLIRRGLKEVGKTAEAHPGFRGAGGGVRPSDPCLMADYGFPRWRLVAAMAGIAHQPVLTMTSLQMINLTSLIDSAMS